MKQKLWAWGDDFTIKDEQGRDCFLVDGEAFSFGKKLSFQDLQGRELAYIQQRILAWAPTYEIWYGGEHFATVKKELFTFFRTRFLIDVPGPDDLEAEGDFLSWEYTFTRHGVAVARTSKEFFNWTDAYGIDIVEGEDDVLILAAAVVIDAVCFDKS